MPYPYSGKGMIGKTGVAPRRGFFEWHTAECSMDLRHPGSVFSYDTPYRAYWCETHGQWCHEYPAKVVYTFDDGETIERKLP